LARFQPFQKKKNANTTLPRKAAQTPHSATDDGQNARSPARLHSACQDAYCNNLEAYSAPQSPHINADINMSAGSAGTITSLSDKIAEANNVGHHQHGTTQFTVTHTEWQAMRNYLSECIKKTRVTEETNNKLLAKAAESPNYMCSKIIKLQEQLHDKINQCRELRLDVLRWKEHEETREYDLIAHKTQVHDFSDESAERTPAAKCATLYIYICTYIYM